MSPGNAWMEMVSPMRDAEIHCAWLCLSDGPGGTSWQKDKRPTVLIRVSDEQDAVSFPEELQYYRQRNEELQMEVDKLEEVLAQMEEDSMGQQQVDSVPFVIIPCPQRSLSLSAACKSPRAARVQASHAV
jgi:hypothetical protein